MWYQYPKLKSILAHQIRPISLLSILSKILERHVHSLITEHISVTHPLADNQWGFRARRGTTLALLTATNDWMQSLDYGIETCAIFFDFKKAFDSIPHQILITKLKSLQLNPALIRWIFNYLFGRYQSVVVEGAISRATRVISGVPQGSVLGPLLFLLYIDSLSHLQLSPGSKMVFYADDVLLYRSIYLINDYYSLQDDINKIFNWSTTNFLTLNPSKCKQMLISRKRNHLCDPPLQLGNSILEKVNAYKYLGINIATDLSWSDHIHAKCSKAKKMIGLIYRQFQGSTDMATLFTLYVTLVRPHLEYACSVWCPHLQRDIKKIEQVQKFGLRMCTRRWNADYNELLLLFNIPSLHDRRCYLSLCTMYKIIYENVEFPPNFFTPKPPSHLRSSTSALLFIQPFAKTNFRKYSFLPHISSIWNNLPTHVTKAQSLMAFKMLLYRHIMLSYVIT